MSKQILKELPELVEAKVISEETKELLRQYSKMNSENLRVEMGLE